VPYEAGRYRLQMTLRPVSRAEHLLDEGFELWEAHSAIQFDGLANPKVCFDGAQSDVWNQDLTYLETPDLSHRIVTNTGRFLGGASSPSSLYCLEIVARGRGCLLIGGFGFKMSFQLSHSRRSVGYRSVLRPFSPYSSAYWLQTLRLARIECPGCCVAS
jgi:hypothetical protein